jgi:hypothetical protein
MGSFKHVPAQNIEDSIESQGDENEDIKDRSDALLLDRLGQILTVLKKIETHLSQGSDEEL